MSYALFYYITKGKSERACFYDILIQRWIGVLILNCDNIIHTSIESEGLHYLYWLMLSFYYHFRYKAIVWPLKVRTSKAVVALTIFMIWIGSIIFALPALLLSKT